MYPNPTGSAYGGAPPAPPEPAGTVQAADIPAQRSPEESQSEPTVDETAAGEPDAEAEPSQTHLTATPDSAAPLESPAPDGATAVDLLTEADQPADADADLAPNTVDEPEAESAAKAEPEEAASDPAAAAETTDAETTDAETTDAETTDAEVTDAEVTVPEAAAGEGSAVDRFETLTTDDIVVISGADETPARGEIFASTDEITPTEEAAADPADAEPVAASADTGDEAVDTAAETLVDWAEPTAEGEETDAEVADVQAIEAEPVEAEPDAAESAADESATAEAANGEEVEPPVEVAAVALADWTEPEPTTEAEPTAEATEEAEPTAEVTEEAEPTAEPATETEPTAETAEAEPEPVAVATDTTEPPAETAEAPETTESEPITAAAETEPFAAAEAEPFATVAEAEPEPAAEAEPFATVAEAEPEPAAEAAEPTDTPETPQAEPVPVAAAAESAAAAEATEPAETEDANALRPGDVVEARIAVWASADAEGFRVRIREAGNLFVDDPGFAVTTAAAVVTEAVNALAAALQAQHAELDPRSVADNPDTESLRVAIRRYREFLDRVLAL